MIFMSVDFEKCDHCRHFCLHALESVNKPYVVVSVGKGQWQSTHLGYRIGAQEVGYPLRLVQWYYRKVSNIRRTKSQNLNASRLIL